MMMMMMNALQCQIDLTNYNTPKTRKWIGIVQKYCSLSCSACMLLLLPCSNTVLYYIHCTDSGIECSLVCFFFFSSTVLHCSYGDALWLSSNGLIRFTSTWPSWVRVQNCRFCTNLDTTSSPPPPGYLPCLMCSILFATIGVDYIRPLNSWMRAVWGSNSLFVPA